MRQRLEALFKVDTYKSMCQHEFERQVHCKDPDIMSDVYDSDAWKTFMGPAVSPNNRIGVCVFEFVVRLLCSRVRLTCDAL